MTSLIPPLPHRAADLRKARRDRLLLGVMLLLFAAGIAGLARSTDWSAVAGQFGRLSLSAIAALLLLSAVNYVMRGLRWHLFGRALGLATPLPTSLLQFVAGFAMSVTPGRVGELVRLRWLARDSGRPAERVAPIVLADRASDLSALAILLGAGLALSARAPAGAMTLAGLALSLAFVVTHPRLVAGLAGGMFRLCGHRAPRLFARIRRAARELDAFATAGVFLPALGLGLAGWLAEAAALKVLLGCFGTEIPLARAVTIFVFSTLAGGLTGAPGGLGGAEAAMIALLSLDGTPIDVAVAATLVIRATTLWFAVALGILAFPFAERGTTPGIR